MGQPRHERLFKQAFTFSRSLLAISKPRIGLAVALIAVAGVAVGPGVSPPAWKVAVLVACGLVASAAAGGFNHLYEAGLDRRMGRTGSRPFASGVLEPGAGWVALFAAGMFLAPVSAGILVGPEVAAFIALGAFTYAFVYTVWLKRRTRWNVVVGGLAGSFAALAGSALADPLPSVQSLVMAALVFAWTPPHFWALAIRDRDDYAAAGIPMLPVVKGAGRAADAAAGWAALVLALSILLGISMNEPLVQVVSAVSGTWLLVEYLVLSRRPSTGRAGRCFRVSLVQLGAVLIAIPVARGF
jgi:protoheme IX farnesyltransferase